MNGDPDAIRLIGEDLLDRVRPSWRSGWVRTLAEIDQVEAHALAMTGDERDAGGWLFMSALRGVHEAAPMLALDLKLSMAWAVFMARHVNERSGG